MTTFDGGFQCCMFVVTTGVCCCCCVKVIVVVVFGRCLDIYATAGTFGVSSASLLCHDVVHFLLYTIQFTDMHRKLRN